MQKIKELIKDNKKYVITLSISLILAIFIELVVFIIDFKPKSETTSILNSPEYSMGLNNYDVSGNCYKANSVDPYLIFPDINQPVETVMICFTSPISLQKNDIQFFYSTDGVFSESNSFKLTKRFGKYNVKIELPRDTYTCFRFDIEGTFYLDDIVFCDGPISLSPTFTDNFSFSRAIVIFAGIFLALFAFYRWKNSKRNEINLTNFEMLFCLICFVSYTLWAVCKPLNYGPDEAMRYDVSLFLFKNNRLPVGDELLSPWGFSYAHMPTVLCNLLSFITMKLASVFTINEFLLLISARMVSVICGTVTVYFVIKATKLLFNSSARWIMIVFVSFMPQFMFLSSYLNNDIVALMGVSIIFYAWSLALHSNWNFKNSATLAIGISICALSYFNSYSWILFSIVFFIMTYLMKNKKDYKGFAKITSFIVLLVFIMIGYTFLRHVVLYGDLLGFKTGNYYGELYAQDYLKPSARITLFERGVSLFTMLFSSNYHWVETSWISFIGVFGPMSVFCDNIIYEIITSIIVITSIALLAKLIITLIKKEKIDKSKIIFYISVAMSAIVTVCLSIYYSYCSDYQPQGRYCYPAMIALSFFVAKGFEFLMNLLPKKEHKCAAVCSFCVGFILISVLVFNTVYLPS